MLMEIPKPSDREAVNALALQVHRLHVDWQPEYYNHTEMLYDEDRFQKALDQGMMYVAKENGEIVGYVLLAVIEINHAGLCPTKTMKLDELCVAEGFRSRGIGKQIMADVKAIAAQMGCTDIRLTCAPQNSAAIALYEGMGMQIKNLQYFLML